MKNVPSLVEWHAWTTELPNWLWRSWNYNNTVTPFHAKKLFVLFLVAVLKLLADTLVCIECFKLLADSTQVDAGESEELLHKSMYESQILYRLKLLHPFF